MPSGNSGATTAGDSGANGRGDGKVDGDGTGGEGSVLLLQPPMHPPIQPMIVSASTEARIPLR